MNNSPYAVRPVLRRSVECLSFRVDDAGFLDRVSRFAHVPYSGILLSGGTLDCSRYSIAVTDPFMVFTSKGRNCEVRSAHGVRSESGDPLEVLGRLCRSLVPNYGLDDLPFAGGAVGYLAYDLKNQIEELPRTAPDDTNLPDILVFWPLTVLIHDRRAGTLTQVTLDPEGHAPLVTGRPDRGFHSEIEPQSHNDTKKTHDQYKIHLDDSGATIASDRTDQPHGNSIVPLCLGGGYSCFKNAPGGCMPPLGEPVVGAQLSLTPCKATPAALFGNLRSTFSRDGYLDAVERIRTYIRNGDVYQVNLSQRLEFPFDGDSFELWRTLFRMNPAPFFAFIQAGDHQVLSTSMERFLFRRGKHVETRPIKGTRKRGTSPEEDRQLREELARSPKDDAELSMIVDLLRNDLGRVCEPRSIGVAEHKRLEGYENVYHLVSIVTGTLRHQVSHTDLIRATFPGGSITGCPKIRAMEIIDELEPVVRHVYTGCIGYLGWHDNLDMNIAIRTAVLHRGRGLLSVGGGVVYDSDPADEYDETLHKGRTFLKLFGHTGAGLMNNTATDDQCVIWLNGHLVPAAEARISPFDRGWLYGDGLFETMRAEQGLVLYLEDHLHRIGKSAAFLGIDWNHSRDWSAVFRELLVCNGLDRDVAAAKMVLTRGRVSGLGLPAAEVPTLCLTVQRYHGPDDPSYNSGWKLTVFREGYAPPLASHKSLNYLYYLTARQYALDRGYDEAILLDAQGGVTETAAGSLLVKIDGKWWKPGSRHQLPGITAARVSELLGMDGDPVSERDLEPHHLAESDTIWVCNSLMGVMPVREVDRRPLSAPSVEQAVAIREALFAQGRNSR